MKNARKKGLLITGVLGAATLCSAAASAWYEGSGWYGPDTYTAYANSVGKGVIFAVDYPSIAPQTLERTESVNYTTWTKFYSQQYCNDWTVRNGPERQASTAYSQTSTTGSCLWGAGGTWFGGVWVENAWP